MTCQSHLTLKNIQIDEYYLYTIWITRNYMHGTWGEILFAL